MQTEIARWREELDINGFTELGSQIAKSDVNVMRDILLAEQEKRIQRCGLETLNKYGEREMIRNCAVLNNIFCRLLEASWVNALINVALNERAILHGYHGIISDEYSSGELAQPFRFHRDSPWFKDTRVCLLILMPLVDFTPSVGPTEVVPGSHLFENMPSQDFMEKHAKPMLMPAGHVFAMDGTLCHRGTRNMSVFKRPLLQMNVTVAFFKQQIDVLHGDLRESFEVKNRLGQRVRTYQDPDEMLTDNRKWTSGNYDITNCRIKR